MIAFIEGGMTLPMGRITRDYLLNHRLCPHQCAPNLFKVLRSVDALNDQMKLGLTWHNVVHMYECHSSLYKGGHWNDNFTLLSICKYLVRGTIL